MAMLFAGEMLCLARHLDTSQVLDGQSLLNHALRGYMIEEKLRITDLNGAIDFFYFDFVN